MVEPSGANSVTVIAAAETWGLTPNRVRQQIREGKLPFFEKVRGVLRAPGSAVRGAKVFSPTSLFKDHGISPDELRKAKLVGVVKPSKNGRYSVNDIGEVRRATEARKPRQEHISRGLSDYVCNAKPYDFAAVLLEYHTKVLRPADLPLWFWDRPKCPTFEPPTGMFRFFCGQTIANGQTEVMITAGWFMQDDGSLSRIPATNPLSYYRLVEGHFPAGSTPPGDEKASDAYDACHAEWDSCYERARRLLNVKSVPE
jgi:hypothetical protein